MALHAHTGRGAVATEPAGGTGVANKEALFLLGKEKEEEYDDDDDKDGGGGGGG